MADRPPLSHSRSSAQRRVTLAVGSLAAVGVISSLVLLALVAEVASIVSAMRRDELAMHEGLMLGVAVREQYIHEAHTLIERTDAHLDHHHAWVDEVARSAAALHGRVPQSHEWRVTRIAETSVAIDAAFRSTVVPAVRAGDLAAVRTEHQRIDALVTRAADDADAVATSLEARMHEAHVRAEATARSAVAVAAIGGALALLLAAYHGWRLRARVLRPLRDLVGATRIIAEGRIPDASDDGDDEVRAVGAALRKLASDLHEREARLVTSERMAVVGQLAAGVAHEVNNPIGIIRGYLRTMLPEAQDPQLRDELRILDEEAEACQRIADDLLSFARTGELRRTEVEVREVVSEQARRLEGSGELRGAQVRVDVEPATLWADGVRLRQVVSNLLRNAAESKLGGTIDVVGRADPGGYRIEVHDSGPGVAPADRDRIFEPFYGHRPGGAGLGLAVCLGVVRAHGGTLTVANGAAEGAIFVVTLPLTADRVSS
jgi:two-component system NtrC family sensor kinase